MIKYVECSVGHTPDSDDAFMFYAMLTGKIQSPDFTIKHVIGDIEELNKKASNPELDVTAVSVHACAYIPNYTILRSGGSFGLGYGPIVIGKFEYVEMNFTEIPKAVLEGKVDAGLVIHETQLSYDQEKLTKILDVGEWWDKTTNGLPVPLGINVINNRLGSDIIKKFDNYLRDSINYARSHTEEALDYAMQYSRGKQRSLIEKFVKMYVNDVTVDMGKKGEESIRHLFDM